MGLALHLTGFDSTPLNLQGGRGVSPK